MVIPGDRVIMVRTIRNNNRIDRITAAQAVLS